MRYRYTRLNQSLLLPYLDICLRNGFATTGGLFGLVDSGSNYCIFGYEIAQALKLEFPDPNKVWTFRGTTGKLQIAYRATVEITVRSDERPHPDFQFSAEVGFCPDFDLPGPLLGQYGFFSNFKTQFFQPQNYFEIEPYQASLNLHANAKTS